MASDVIAGGVQVTEATHIAIREYYRCERREAVEVKGKGPMTTYLVLGPLAPESAGGPNNQSESKPALCFLSSGPP